MIMELYSILGSVMTVVSFLVFIGIVMWACSSRRRGEFEAAAQAPFALPDDGAATPLPSTGSRGAMR